MNELTMKNQSGRIVVGYDGSQHSRAALEWAAGEARRRGLALTVLHAIDYTSLIGSPMAGFGWPDLASDPSRLTATKGAELVRRDGEPFDGEPFDVETFDVESFDVESITVFASAAGVLLRAAETADLVVVGTRGHGDLAAAIVGSVAFTVSAHARCPVVVVRGTGDHPAADRPVVVGVDGSPYSEEAVRYAADVANSAGAPLRIVCAYRGPASTGWAEAAHLELEAKGGPDFETVARGSALEVAQQAESTARQAYPDLAVNVVVQEGPPARVLIDAAVGAGTVIVGSRGRGGFVGLLLGSVGHALIHAATCPVTIVHGPRIGGSATAEVTESESGGLTTLTSGVPAGLL